ncbi:hypothetical protein Sjap_015996 [Stephania japonica]|uniref:Thiol-disulfide oxidoreductase DCC n=1 Tax=Stephania japonica TaxID=461633 RepID=A0AAP0IK69_9MAGN
MTMSWMIKMTMIPRRVWAISAFRSRAPSSSPCPVADVVVADPDLLSLIPPLPPKNVDKPSLLQPRVVVFDGVCHLCHSGVKWVISVDKYRKIKFCCLQSKAAEPYLEYCGVTREEVLRRFVFVEGPGSCYQASTAALQVISYLPLPYSALSAFLIIPKPLRDSVYDYVAKHRYDWFGKENQCIVMKEQELLDRFIDREEIIGSK